MMQDNTARQIEYGPLEAEPERQANQAPQARPVALPRHVAFSPVEKLLCTLCGVAVVAFSLLFVSTQNTLANVNRSYQDIQSEITTQNQHIDDYKQNIGELTNSDRLNNFAKAHGYTVIEGNIKRVNK